MNITIILPPVPIVTNGGRTSDWTFGDSPKPTSPFPPVIALSPSPSPGPVDNFEDDEWAELRRQYEQASSATKHKVLSRSQTKDYGEHVHQNSRRDSQPTFMNDNTIESKSKSTTPREHSVESQDLRESKTDHHTLSQHGPEGGSAEFANSCGSQIKKRDGQSTSAQEESRRDVVDEDRIPEGPQQVPHITRESPTSQEEFDSDATTIKVDKETTKEEISHQEFMTDCMEKIVQDTKKLSGRKNTETDSSKKKQLQPKIKIIPQRLNKTTLARQALAREKRRVYVEERIQKYVSEGVPKKGEKIEGVLPEGVHISQNKWRAENNIRSRRKRESTVPGGNTCSPSQQSTWGEAYCTCMPAASTQTHTSNGYFYSFRVRTTGPVQMEDKCVQTGEARNVMLPSLSAAPKNGRDRSFAQSSGQSVALPPLFLHK